MSETYDLKIKNVNMAKKNIEKIKSQETEFKKYLKSLNR